MPPECCRPQGELLWEAWTVGLPGSAKQHKRAPLAVDHTWQAPLLSHDATSLLCPGRMHSDTTAPSCPAHCTPAARYVH